MAERKVRKLCDTVSAEADGMSVGKYLLRITGLTRPQIRNLKYRENGICVNGSRVRVTYILHTGDILELCLGDGERKKMSALDGSGSARDTGSASDGGSGRASVSGSGSAGDTGGCSGSGSARDTGGAIDGESGHGGASDGESGSASEYNRNSVSAGGLHAASPEILYEDEDLLIAWKQAGQLVHPAGGNQKENAETLSELISAYLASRGEACVMRSIGRLDREATGIVVFAKNRIAASRLWEQRKNGTFRKEYLALCEGILPCDGLWHTIDAPIAGLSKTPVKMHIAKNGQPAVTHYQALRQIPRSELADREWQPGTIQALEMPDIFTLLRVHIDTGRTHQIRVHMACLGHPLFGDPLYGADDPCYETGDPLYGTGGAPLGLCAWKVWLLQPFTGRSLFCVSDHVILPRPASIKNDDESRRL